MLLSEAIMLGSMATEQCFGGMEDEDGRRCALGAAALAIGGNIMMLDEFPWLGQAEVCPVCHESNHASYIIAQHLNDAHRWTRERIADWVATVEPRDEPTVDPVEVLAEVDNAVKEVVCG